MKICPICRAQFNTKAALAQHMASVHPLAGSSRQPRRGNSGNNNARAQQSTITFSRTEFLGSLMNKNIRLQPGATGARQLDNIAAIFEQYRWDRLSFSFRSTVGSNANGLYFAGISYEPDHFPTTQTDIASCSPCVSHAVSKESTLQAPVRQLMEQSWLPTSAQSGDGKTQVSGFLNLASDQKLGVWMSYQVTFSGPTSITRVIDTAYLYSKKDSSWRYKDENEEQITTANPTDEPESLDIELDTGDEATANRMLDQLRRVWENLTQSYRVVVDGVTYIHAIAQRVNRVVLPSLAVAAIVHRRPLPFRNPVQLRELRGDRSFASFVTREDVCPRAAATED